MDDLQEHSGRILRIPSDKGDLNRSDTLPGILRKQLLFQDGSWHLLQPALHLRANQKCDDSLLCYLDVFEIDGIRCVWLENAVAVFDGCIHAAEKISRSPVQNDPVDLSGFEEQIFFLENPKEPPISAEASSSSPHAMMLISACTAMVCSLFIMGSDLKGVLSSGMNTLLMAFGMMGWNYRNRRKERMKREKALSSYQNNYLQILADHARKGDEIRKSAQEKTEAAVQALLEVDERLPVFNENEPWILPCALVLKTAVRWKPKNEWSNSSDGSLNSFMQEMIDHPLEAPVLRCIHPGDSWDGSSLEPAQLWHLYLLWIRMAANAARKAAWIGFSKPEIVCSASRYRTDSLYFSDSAAFERFAADHPFLEWIVFTKVPLRQKDPLWTVIEYYPHKTSPDRIIDPSATFLRHRSFEAKQIRRICQAKETGSFKGELLETLHCRIRRSGRADVEISLSEDVAWDLRKDGPHALCAGSTGSGKSEGLTLCLLQLAFINPPEYLQLILIDFKGGSFAAPFARLPHTAAMLTNLQIDSIARLEQALSQELDRRQNLIAKAVRENPSLTADADHCLQADHGHPFSEIIICVDEFGQLKSRAPEFLKSLQETARIGRSLGVHLILATQKPAGLVDEQIWANSKSKLCFKVNDPTDSREVLGHDQASRLTRPGEFILQSSDGKEENGRAFFLKDPQDPGGEVFFRIQKDESEQPSSWTMQKSKTLQEAMLDEIFERYENQRIPLLMTEDPYESRAESSEILIDQISRCVPFFPQKGSTLAIGGSKEDLEHAAAMFAAHSDLPVCTNHVLNNVHQALPAASLYLLSELNQEVLVLAWIDEKFPLELLNLLDQSKNVTLVALMASIDYRFSPFLQDAEGKIGFEFAGREAELMFFQKVSERKGKSGLAIGSIGKKDVRIIFGSRIPKTEPLLIPAAKIEPVVEEKQGNIRHGISGLAGIDPSSCRPLKVQKPFVIGYAGSEGQKIATRLIRRLAFEDPSQVFCDRFSLKGDVYLADLNQADDTAAAKEMPILFAGNDLASVSYSLGVRAPLEALGNGFLIEGSSVRDILLLQMIESMEEQKKRCI